MKDFNIIWLNHDLRLWDNYSIHEGCHLPVIFIYIIREDYQWNSYSFWYLLNQLMDLNQRITQLGGDLYIMKYEENILENFLNQWKPNGIFWSKSYEPIYVKWHNNIEEFCKNNGILYKESCNNHYYSPEQIFNLHGCPYNVFTPFWKNLSSKIPWAPLNLPLLNFKKLPIESLNISNHYGEFLKNHEFLKNYWNIGEINSHQQLKEFVQKKLLNYKHNRDFISVNVCSQLSPALRWGVITDRQIYAMVHYYHNNNRRGFFPIELDGTPSMSDMTLTEPFLRQLGWRSFSYHLLWHYPGIVSNNLKKSFDNFPWVYDDNLLNKWQKGLTGYPIVDAGMRELLATGYMHNRVRMIVASFLTKDLKIHWTEGAKHFWQYLVDADEANNSASWQWVAGCGMDAAPYFRIFNPMIQSIKFDPQGLYIKKWIPELNKISSKYIHDPWNHTHNIPIQLGREYPQPIVDHYIERQKALDIYKEIHGKNTPEDINIA